MSDSKVLSRQVYDWLMGQLLTRQLRPGTWINRRQVAQAVGVSPAPATEAMLQLEAEGFLESHARRGTRVREIDPAEVAGRLVVREALETQAARLYCGAPVAANESWLLKLAKVADAHMPWTMENWHAEVEFHQALVELTACGPLIESFRQVMRHSLFYAVNELLPTAAPMHIPDRHVQMIQVLKSASPDEAERLMRAHVRQRSDAVAPS